MAVIYGGDKLRRHLMELAVKLQKPATLNVGFLEGATYPDGTPVAEVAAHDEYGVPAHNQPPRPYFRGMISRKSGNWGKGVGDLLKANHYDAEKALGMMGEGIKGQLQESITELSDPANAPSTIAKKGFDDPLVDTGHMLNSVDYEVKG
jgi:hypothetical protein